MLARRIKPVALQARKIYVKLMMEVVGRSLQAISDLDPSIREETRVLPDGFLFEMTVMPHGPALVMQKLPKGRLRYCGEKGPETADLSIRFKHIAHAFRVLSFQEKTSEAFAYDRMLVDGDIGYALRMTRVLNRLEAFILPKLLAERAVKEYPGNLGLSEKLLQAARIYLQVASQFLATVKLA